MVGIMSQIQGGSALAILCFLAFGRCAEVEIGNWTYNAHGARAGMCTLLNDRQIRIQGFNYDGKGPEAWFMADINGTRKQDPNPCCNYRAKDESVIIPDDKGQCHHKPEPYSGQDIVLTLPSTLTWKAVDFVGLYCYKHGHLFGYVKIPAMAKDTSLNPYKGAELSMEDCVKQQDRILADEYLAVQCTSAAPANTTGGYFP